MKLNKMVLDDKKIDEAARGAADLYEQDLPMMSYDEDTEVDGQHHFCQEFGAELFKDGARWMQEEFLKNLWHPMQEEPKLVGEEIIIDEFLEGKRYPMVQKYMVGVEFPPTIETIRWISNWDSFLSEICDEVKMIRWCYFKDLLPKKGGEQ